MLRLYWDESIDFCEECVVKKACDRGELDLSCACVGSYQIRDESEEPAKETIETLKALAVAVPEKGEPVLALIRGERNYSGNYIEFYEVVFFDGTNWHPFDRDSKTFTNDDQIIVWEYTKNCLPINQKEK